jgi:hypothetical protein
MKKKPQRKLLVPVDGSDRSINTVKYISKFEPFRRMRVILFHVFSKVPAPRPSRRFAHGRFSKKEISTNIWK